MNIDRTRCVLVVFAACGVLAVAAQAQGPAGRPAARPPAIDPLSASIRGRTTTDTGAPIRRAEIRAVSDGGVSRMTTSDGDGRFELRDLPAGSFRVSASKSGFVTLQYGQRRVLEAGKAVELKEGGSATADMTLPRGGAIAGRIYDRFGEPLANVRVDALRSRFVQGSRRIQPAGIGDVTDDTGAFRLFGLTPGEYYVAARPAGGRPGDGRALVFYPGTSDIAQAQRLTVDAAAEASALFQLVPLATSSVGGTVVNASGSPIEASVSLFSEALGLGYANPVSGVQGGLTLSGHAGPDGRFFIDGVPPGPYTAQASGLVQFGPDGPIHNSGRTGVTVDGPAVTGLTIVTGSGGTITGTFVRDPAATQPTPADITVSARGSGPSMVQGRGNTFRLTGIAGPVRLGVDGLPEGWVVKSISVEGDDVTDKAFDVRSGQTATARVVLTNRVTQVSGAVTPRPRAGDASVVIFADDSTKWTYPSRYVSVARADENGRFGITGLPGGERYLAIAVDYLEDGEETDPEFLERMRARATAVSLPDAGRTTVDLRLIAR